MNILQERLLLDALFYRFQISKKGSNKIYAAFLDIYGYIMNNRLMTAHVIEAINPVSKGLKPSFERSLILT
jgi:hypothetical protein